MLSKSGIYRSLLIYRIFARRDFPGSVDTGWLMRLHGIRGVCRRRVTWRCAVSSEVMAEDLLHRQYDATQPNQKWSGDLTSVTQEGVAVCGGAVGLYSCRVVGWAMGARITTELTHMALAMAGRGIVGTRLSWRASLRENLTDLSPTVSEQAGGEDGHSYLYRRLLYPASPPLDLGISQPHGV